MGHGYKDLEKKKSSDKLRDYRRSDKKSGLTTNLSLEELRGILSMPCFYCTSTERIGADRIDSTKGHEIKNVVSCCARCNFFFGDIPYAAKIELREGMRIINQKGLMDNWVPPPERSKKPEKPIEWF